MLTEFQYTIIIDLEELGIVVYITILQLQRRGIVACLGKKAIAASGTTTYGRSRGTIILILILNHCVHFILTSACEKIYVPVLIAIMNVHIVDGKCGT